MHPLQKQFHDVIIKKQLFRKEEKVLLAVSGGVDSMVMAHLFLASEYSFGIAHCNFGLRGVESDQDEKLVRAWADENRIECHVNYFELEKGSIQIAARKARYAWFDQLCVEHGYHKIATAHHLNDSLETSLLNLARGTGIKGISGIQPKSGNIVRPLLITNKERILEYAREEKILWREDASNAKIDYDRNLLRHQVVPEIKKINPSLDDTFSNTVERLQLTNQLFQEKVEETKVKYLSKENNLNRLQIGWIAKETDFLILSAIIAEFGFNYVTSKEVFGGLEKSGRKFISAQYELTVDRACIYIKKLERAANLEIVIDGEGHYDLGDVRLDVSLVGRNEVEFDSNKNRVFLDAKKVDFPLKVGYWTEGDRFRPLGMKGTKKVSDYLIDNKVPVALKEQVRVLVSGKNIVWLMGQQISEDFKICSVTDSVLKLKITN